MRTWQKEEIRNIILNSNPAVERGLLAIFQRQTTDEQHIQIARHRNNIGFSGAHASRGSYYAKWIQSGKHLSGEHVLKGRKLILHYVRQLVEIANEKAQKVCAVDECSAPAPEHGAYCQACSDAWEVGQQDQAFGELHGHEDYTDHGRFDEYEMELEANGIYHCRNVTCRNQIEFHGTYCPECE